MAVAQTCSQLTCFHCGESCGTSPITWEEKSFCCEGCKLVFQLLNQHGLCDYYTFNTAPGINRKRLTRQDKFAFLEDPQISKKLVTFQNEDELHITFYLPQIHCSSCLYLLEQLHQIEPGILHSKVNFPRKEVSLVLHTPTLSLRQAAEVLMSIGYEPYISLHDLQSPTPRIPRQQIYQLGVAGFCFGNIMLLSFPEYLGLNTLEQGLHQVFRFLNVGLSLPVFFYSALPFFNSGWKSIQLKRPNIDAPIALAIIVTFCRSLYEVLSGTGSGYFDSMTGIVFFMLIGRMLQEKTYQQLSFERDYTHYFPIAVTILKENTRTTKALPDLHTGDTLLIRNEELIPADGILTRGHA
ncbi:MAG: heavy metal translocating P-type ATPase metal-binding domain-containing protein, partial [Chitinophagaceae bacterium]